MIFIKKLTFADLIEEGWEVVGTIFGSIYKKRNVLKSKMMRLKLSKTES